MEASQELSFLATLLPLAAVVFIIAIGVILLNQRFHRNLYIQKIEREELKTRHQRELLRSSIHIQEDERKRIASDLHDELGATLSLARMHLVQLEQQIQDKTGMRYASLHDARSLTESAIHSMRRISHELMPPQLETFGLVRTLEKVGEQLNSANQIEFRLHTQPGQARFPWPVELGLYRISMELINNTLKHAGATEIHCQLYMNDTAIRFHYIDNGKGMSVNHCRAGAGLKNIEARVSSLLGSVKFPSVDHESFSAFIEIPVNDGNGRPSHIKNN